MIQQKKKEKLRALIKGAIVRFRMKPVIKNLKKKLLLKKMKQKKSIIWRWWLCHKAKASALKRYWALRKI
jgi:hypothetical protein